MSVKKNLSFGLENLRIDKSEIEERIKSAASCRNSNPLLFSVPIFSMPIFGLFLVC